MRVYKITVENGQLMGRSTLTIIEEDVQKACELAVEYAHVDDEPGSLNPRYRAVAIEEMPTLVTREILAEEKATAAEIHADASPC